MQYPESRLPQIGTTIFSRMSALAAAQGAINLSQGFPDFDGPAELLASVDRHIQAGHNQYAPMTGVPALCEQIAAKVERCYGRQVDVNAEVTVTSGATEALFAAIAAVVRSGDEVILFDPAYDSYEPAVQLNGGRAVHIPLQEPDFGIDWQRLQDAITPRTRLIVLNFPHNPSGATLTAEDLEHLEALVADTSILLLSDEVYEHILFDGKTHQSLHRRPALAERSFIVSSFGKTYHITGWKVGYCVAPPVLSQELRKVHQYLTFSTATPIQWALADYMARCPDHEQELAGFYQRRRDHFNAAMTPSRFRFTATAGTYFQLMDYRAISDLPDTEFAEWLVRTAGVAAIPLSVFYADRRQTGLIRFCFAKDETTLTAAAERLCRL